MVIMEMIQRLWLVEKNGQTSFPNLNRKKKFHNPGTDLV